jgi:hypothetical protein
MVNGASGSSDGSERVAGEPVGGACGAGDAVGRGRAGAGVEGWAEAVGRGGVADRSGVRSGGGAGRVTVPLIVKSRSSRGPTVSAGGGLAVLAAGASLSWASAGADPKIAPATNAAMPKRQPALISSRSMP